MNTFRRILFSSTIALAAASVSTASLAPGQVDFGPLVASAQGRVVDVNLGRGMLKLVSLVARGESAEAASLISSLTQVRVRVLGLDDTNRTATTERVETIRGELMRAGWEPIVTVRGERDEDVSVLVKQRDGEVLDGVVVTVLDGRKREAVLVNVVGEIKPEQLATIGERFQIESLARRTSATSTSKAGPRS